MIDPTLVYEKQFQKDPEDFAPVAEAMALLADIGRQDLLAPWLERAATIDAGRWETLYYHAFYYDLIGSYDAAIECWERLLILHPEVDPQGLGLARSGLAVMKLDQALAVCEHALSELHKDEPFDSPIFNKYVYTHHFHILASEILLRKGDLRGFAYALAQVQVRCPSYRVAQMPVWSNQSLAASHVLIMAAAGYGDQFLYASFIPKILALGCRVTFVVHPHLHEFFAQTFPTVRVLACDMATELLQNPPNELLAQLAQDPPLMQASLWQLPLMCALLRPHEPISFDAYLDVPRVAQQQAEREIAELRARADGRRIVGIAWDRLQRYYPGTFGAVEAARTERSSLPQSFLASIVNDPVIAEHVHFVALHEQNTARPDAGLLPSNCSEAAIIGGDFTRTAALISACDLIVSVDMSVANLASMLGQTTWLMLSHESDWRWGIGEQSPWIADTRLFRQPVPGDWQSVVDQTIAALRAEFAKPARPHMDTVHETIVTPRTISANTAPSGSAQVCTSSPPASK